MLDLRIVEVGDALVVRGRLALAEAARGGIAISGDIALIGGRELAVVDIADLEAPPELGHVTASGSDVAMYAVDGNAAYLSSGNGLVPVDLGCRATAR